MKTCVVFNPNAGSAELWEQLRQKLSVGQEIALRDTRGPDDARRLAREALEQGYGLIVAAGGDGTISAVVDGLSADFSRATLGIIPLGTGNDLARTLEVPREPEAAIDLLRSGKTRTIDLIRVSSEGRTIHCVNCCAGGFSGQVDEILTDEMKQTWGPLAFMRGAIKALPDLTNYCTTIAYDDGSQERILALNIIVANGRTAAGGLEVAPEADPEDGLLDVVIVRPGTVTELAGVAARLLGGDYTDSDIVAHRRARRVTVASQPACGSTSTANW